MCRLYSLGWMVLFLSLSACGPSENNNAPAASVAAANGARSGAQSAVSVTTVLAQKRDFAVRVEAVGTVVPSAIVDLKPQTTSVITRVHVREGQFVQTGDLLFSLDARADEANLAKAQAQLDKDTAALVDAKRQLVRNRELLAQNYATQGAVDTSQAQVDSLQASVHADLAALDAAKLSLSYDHVRAPSSGRIGVVPVYVGTLVQANQTSLLTITQIQPVDVSFGLPQRHLADALAALRSGQALVKAQLVDDNSEWMGRLSFVDSTVDAASGTVKVKARYANTKTRLWPNAFVHVSMNVGQIKDAVVIPLAAIIQSAKGSVVYVNHQGKAAFRSVQVQASQGEEAAVTGVEAGEKVVVEGKQNLRPEMPLVERSQAQETGKRTNPGLGQTGVASAQKDAP